MTENIMGLPFPTKVFRGPEALNCLGDFCKNQGKRAFILGGKTALNKTKENIYQSLAQAGVNVVATEWYGGQCSRENIQKRANEAVKLEADIIIAVGGGKALDTGKAVGAKCHLPVITVPTIAATCAAITPLSVLYNDMGEFADNLF